MDVLFFTFDMVVTICLVVLVVKVLTIEKYVKRNQDHIADLFQKEIDRLTKEIKEK